MSKRLPLSARLRCTFQQVDPFSASLALSKRRPLARERGSATLTAYKTDVELLIRWLGQNTPLDQSQEIERTDISEYLVLHHAGFAGLPLRRV